MSLQKLNPLYWAGTGIKVGWSWLGDNVSAGALDAPFMAGSIILIWFLMFGAKWPKKWLYWAWIAFWAIRGFVFI